jgi:hypothetical protein
MPVPALIRCAWLQRVLDRRVAQRPERTEVVADGGDIGSGVVGDLTKRHAVLAAPSQHLQSRRQEQLPSAATRLATLIRPFCFHEPKACA